MRKILLNALNYDARGAGISKYTAELVKALHQIEPTMLNFLIRKNCENEFIEQSTSMRTTKYVCNTKSRIIFEQVFLSWTTANYKLLHFTDYTIPIFTNHRCIATIHDLAMYNIPEAYTKSQIIFKRYMFQKTIKRAELLICDSHYTKKELIKRFPAVSGRATVIYPGIKIPKYECDEVSIRKKLCKYKLVRGNFILFVGTISPHKNLDRLLQAFEIIKADPIHQEIKLVIAGKCGWKYNSFFAELSRSNYRDDIIVEGYVPASDLEILMRNAGLFVSTSYHEGFGFPPLEALGRGTPIAVSNIEIFRETCGDAAFYFDPYNVENIARSISCALNSADLRESKLKIGKDRVNSFSWEKTALEIRDLYRSLGVL